MPKGESACEFDAARVSGMSILPVLFAAVISCVAAAPDVDVVERGPIHSDHLREWLNTKPEAPQPRRAELVDGSIFDESVDCRLAAARNA